MAVDFIRKQNTNAVVEDSNSHSLPERRKHVRYFPHQEAFAALGGSYSKVGRITAISMGGLSFEYMVFHDTQEENTSVEIFLGTGAVYIHHMPCQVVADKEIDVHPTRSGQLKFFSSRLCKIRFTEMSTDQQRELEDFIRTHTSSSLKP
jgi:hypothetical protein